MYILRALGSRMGMGLGSRRTSSQWSLPDVAASGVYRLGADTEVTHSLVTHTTPFTHSHLFARLRWKNRRTSSQRVSPTANGSPIDPPLSSVSVESRRITPGFDHPRMHTVRNAYLLLAKIWTAVGSLGGYRFDESGY